ncbi:MAG: hypothetical protein HOK67_27465 [Deltaproteobacteria bacterium]|jgi:hypothetical protein|nr:hypothetical protein [Deltaproteobacteria bacterium]
MNDNKPGPLWEMGFKDILSFIIAAFLTVIPFILVAIGTLVALFFVLKLVLL